MPLLPQLLRLFAAVLLIGSAASAASSPDVEVLAIGANRSFKDRLPELKFAEQDAKRFGEAMQTVGLVPRVKAQVLTGLTTRELRRTFQAMIAQKDAGAQGKKFIFYFSGHSDDAGLHLKDGLVTKSELHDFLTAMQANTKVAILDSCFSGSLTAKGVEAAPGFELPRMEFDEPSGSVFLTASTGRQLAYESDDLGGSIFTHHLLQGIYGQADGNTDGVVTVDELYQYVYRNTKWQSLNHPGSAKQEPEYVAKLHGQGAIVVSFPARTNGRLVLDADLAGEVAIASPHGLQFFRVPKTAGKEKTVQLPIGTYRMSVRDGEAVGAGEIIVTTVSEVRIARANLAWTNGGRTLTSMGKGDAGGAPLTSTAYARSPRERHVRTLVAMGLHSGFGSGMDLGPRLEAARFFDFRAQGRWRTGWGVSLAFQRARNSVSENWRDYDLVTDTTILAGLGQLGYRTHSNGRPLILGMQLGYAQSYLDQRVQEGGNDVETRGGFAPALVYGITGEAELANGRRIGLSFRREHLSLEKISDDDGARGTSLAATASF